MSNIHPMTEKGQPLGASGASLGTTYEIMQPPPVEWLQARLEFWRLQGVSRKFLPTERVALCFRRKRPLVDQVKILKSHEKCHYGGLIACGSLWVCPVCAAKITEHRRQELVQAIDAWKKMGGTVVMVVHTVPHYAHQTLNTVLEGFTRARRSMLNRKPYKRLQKQIGSAGSVRALEVTHGVNGWHVHDHELLFLAPGCEWDPLEIQGAMLEPWQDACESAGLGRPNFRGVQVQDGSQAAKYAAKWGLECELTKSHVKKGREDNLTPWDFLRQGKKELFCEYAKRFKGKRQLVWSDGLRDLLGLGKPLTDEEIADKEDEAAELLGQLTDYEWAWILRAEKRGELLQVANESGWLGVLRFIGELLREQPFNGCPF